MINREIKRWAPGGVIFGLVCATIVLALTIPAARAEGEKAARIGFLSPLAAAWTASWEQALRQGLDELGWVEGRNLVIDFRYAGGKIGRLPALADELVSLNPVLIVALNSLAARAVQQRDAHIPIVIPYAADPVALGLGTKLAHPGGNITGLSEMVPEIAGKRLELLKDLVPGLTRVAVLWDPTKRASRLTWKNIQAPARRLRLTLESLPVSKVAAFQSAFAKAAASRAGAVALMPGVLFGGNLKIIAALAKRYRQPSIWHRSEFPDAGGLVSYGPDRKEMFRRTATFVHKILKGAKPADLLLEQPTRFHLTVNLKTAKALGIKVPGSVLLRADKVIE